MYTSMDCRTEVRVGGPDGPRQPTTAAVPSPAEPADSIRSRGSGRSRKWPYALGGALLLLMFPGMCVLGALMATSCYELVREGTGMYELYLQSGLFAGTGFIGLYLLPVIAERNCVGRFIARRIPV
ncbi:hypothetical protein [Streptomyces sp. NPDC049887]|uniref:hypothetical protein n=1 Tax=unclassified Streptomyces TaxID=2593676 RepID=UPI003428FA41